jgi:pimeloyl-ACP methyl ester carboxylesterase
MDFPALTIAGALLLAVLSLSGCNLQYRMLYCPSETAPSEQSLAGSKLGFWPSAGKACRGFIGGPEDGAARGTFVVFHGNGGTAVDREFYVKELGSLGYRVILAEYPRYGGRAGELGEAAFVKDGAETVRLAFELYGGPMYLLGESLGAGVAAAVTAATKVPVAGVVLITPWDTLRSVADEHFSPLLVRLFLRDSYDSVTNLSRFRGRIAVVGAERDEIVPLRCARNLFGSLSSPAKRMWVIGKAGHNDWLMYVERSFWKELTDFVTGAAGREAGITELRK